MAKKTTEAPKLAQRQEGYVGPSRMKRLNPERINAWWKPSENAIIEGVLIGFFPRQNREKGDSEGYYQIKVTDPRPEGSRAVTVVTKGSKRAGDQMEDVEVERGEVVNVDERANLKSLRSLAERKSDEIFVVHVHCSREIDLPGGKTMWLFDVFHELVEKDPFGI